MGLEGSKQGMTGSCKWQLVVRAVDALSGSSHSSKKGCMLVQRC